MLFLLASPKHILLGISTVISFSSEVGVRVEVSGDGGEVAGWKVKGVGRWGVRGAWR